MAGEGVEVTERADRQGDQGVASEAVAVVDLAEAAPREVGDDESGNIFHHGRASAH